MSEPEHTDWDVFAVGQSPFRTLGRTFSSLLAYVDRQIAGGRARYFTEVRDPALRAFVTQPFVDDGWYDTLPIVPLCQAAALLTGQTLLGFTRDLARFAVQLDTPITDGARGVAPGAIVEAAPALAKQFFTFLTAEVEKIDDQSYWITSVGVPAFIVQFYMVVAETFLVHALMLAGVVEPQHRWFPPAPAGTLHGLAVVQLRRRVSWT